MTINWFPGHMHKASRAIRERAAQCDVVFEIVDARAPQSSSNPELVSFAGMHQPIRILGKKDLADPACTRAWLKYFEDSVAFNIPREKQLMAKLLPAAKKRAPTRGTVLKPLRIMVIGLPNVGKSTFLNQLLRRKAAHTADTPAVTQQVAPLKYDRTLIFYDTPGIMPARLGTEGRGHRLAALGSVRETAFEETLPGDYLLNYLLSHYPRLLLQRYGLDRHPPTSVAESGAAILGWQRSNTPLPAGAANQAAQKLLRDVRAGRLGKISLEWPEDDDTGSEQRQATGR